MFVVADSNNLKCQTPCVPHDDAADLGPVYDAAAAPSSWGQQQRHQHTSAAATGDNMASDWALDPRMLAFPITKPPPTRWEDVSCVHGRCSRHWGLIRGLIVSLITETMSHITATITPQLMSLLFRYGWWR